MKELFDVPLVFIEALGRGSVQATKGIEHQSSKPTGSAQTRKEAFLKQASQRVFNRFEHRETEMPADVWFIKNAFSSNRFQKKEDRREVEIETVLRVLHEIEPRIDAGLDSLEIDGENRVYLMVEGKKTSLYHLSSGFASLVNIFQRIVESYGAQTNEQELQKVPGIVLIDELDSHLHLSWQVKIVPTLKRIFPNTLFFITSHAAALMCSLKAGEGYRLSRSEEGVVEALPIESPSTTAFIDLIDEVFDIDLNEVRLSSGDAQYQLKAKQALLKILRQQNGDG